MMNVRRGFIVLRVFSQSTGGMNAGRTRSLAKKVPSKLLTKAYSGKVDLLHQHDTWIDLSEELHIHSSFCIALGPLKLDGHKNDLLNRSKMNFYGIWGTAFAHQLHQSKYILFAIQMTF